jgi:hypothetical protein
MTFSIDERDGKKDYCYWYLSGEIKKDNAKQAEQLFQMNFNKCEQMSSTYLSIQIHLNSNGGDVDAAMTIGRLLRKYGVRTVVTPMAKCLSSCVFILMAGLERVAKEKTIGIHRPYFADLNSQAKINEVQHLRFKKIDAIKNYLTEMDIPNSILDLMISIPPDDIKVLLFGDGCDRSPLGQQQFFGVQRVHA